MDLIFDNPTRKQASQDMIDRMASADLLINDATAVHE